MKSCAVLLETDSDCLIRWAAPSVEPVLGWQPPALIGTSMAELIHPDDRKSLATELAEQQLLLRVLRRDGTYQWMKGFSSPLSDDGGEIMGWIFSLQDVDEIVSRRRLLSTVLANVDAHIYMKADDRRYLYANPHVQELMGRPLEEIIGRTDQDLLPAETAAVVTAFDDEVFRTGNPVCREEVIPDQGGRPRIFLSKKMLMREHDQPDCLIGFSTEITELKQTEARLQAREKQLAEARQRYRVMLDSYPGCAVETDRCGIITELSCAMATLTGAQSGPCIGLPLEDVIQDGDKEIFRSSLCSPAATEVHRVRRSCISKRHKATTALSPWSCSRPMRRMVRLPGPAAGGAQRSRREGC